MKKVLLISIWLLQIIGVTAQTITLTFTGKDAQNKIVPLNRVVIANQTRDWQHTIYYPDTNLTMGITGIDNPIGSNNDSPIRLSKNVPNPFDGISEFSLQLFEPGVISMEVYDLSGKMVTTYQGKLPVGVHTFKVLLNTAQSYLLTARLGGNIATIKMVNNGNAGENAIRYVGQGGSCPSIVDLKSDSKGTTNKPFAKGDKMTYIGYATINGVEYTSQIIEKNQMTSENIGLTFNDPGQPWPCGTKIADIDGNTYNTVLIGEQCWMKENLKTTKYADGFPISQGTHSSDEEPYWYYPNDEASNKSAYGLLYTWPTVVRGTSVDVPCEQGICPTGWHVPSNKEWNELFDYVERKSEYGCGGDNEAIAKALASTTGWTNITNTCAIGDNPSSNNATGFSAVPAGKGNGSSFSDFRATAAFWSASQYSYYDQLYPYVHYLQYHNAYVTNTWTYSDNGFSVRCVRGDGTYSKPCPTSLKDVEGNEYSTVKLGKQCWMKENLRTTKYADGTTISQGGSTSTTVAYWYYPNGDSSNKLTYGLLYNFYAVMHGSSTSISWIGEQGICPEGWHVPSSDEWLMLEDYVAEQFASGETAKALASTTGWEPCDSGPGYRPLYNNRSGFNAFPAGCRSGASYEYEYFGEATYFWSGLGLCWYIGHCNNRIKTTSWSDYCGLSVRCLQD